MPRSLSGKPIPVSLDSDMHLAEGERPAFLFRAPTGRQWLEITEQMDQANSAGTLRAKAGAIYDVLKPLLTGWRNMVDRSGETPREILFMAADLDLVVDPGEAAELFAKLQISTDDKKKSDSQP